VPRFRGSEKADGIPSDVSASTGTLSWRENVVKALAGLVDCVEGSVTLSNFDRRGRRLMFLAPSQVTSHKCFDLAGGSP
jgi:hypothetical protein